MCTSAARRLLSRLSLGVLALGVVGACASAPLRQDTPHAGASDAGVEGAAAEATTEDGGAEDAGDDAAPDAEADAAVAQADPVGPCPKHMVLVDGRFCIDRFEASLVEVAADGSEKPYPHYLPVDGHDVRAVSEPGVFPQAFISEVQADDACQASGKRLCTFDEWKTACMGPQKTTFPYGAQRAAAGTCHDAGKSPVAAVFGAAALASVAPAPRSTGAPAPRSAAAPARKGAPARPAASATAGKRPGKRGPPAHTAASRPGAPKPSQATHRAPTKRRGPARASARPSGVAADVWTKLNDPRLGQVEGALSKTGEHLQCVSAWGALDMVGNLHEWVATDRSAAHGTFAGGYFLDTSQNGDGCLYRTVAHAHEYHDYSTGFRCCADVDTSIASR